MKLLFLFAALLMSPVQAQTAPQTVVARAWTEWGTQMVMLAQDCGQGTGSRRAYQFVPRFRVMTIEWGCWGFDDAHIMVQWSDQRNQVLRYQDAWYHWNPTHPVTYHGLYQTLLFLHNNQ